MTLAQRCNLVLAFARVLYVNGQATERTVAAAEQLGRTLGVRAKVMPRWGELRLQSEDENASVIAEVAADPTRVRGARDRRVQRRSAGTARRGGGHRRDLAGAARSEMAVHARGRGRCRGASEIGRAHV